ncbi:membrane protein insertase YidC [Thermodesulfobacteriota bacterium]
MEQARLFVAIALSLLVFLLWNFFFVEKKPIQQPEEKREATEVKEETITPESIDSIDIEKDLATGFLSDGFKAERVIAIDTPLYTVMISAKGAVFKSFVLKDYRERVADGSPQKELISELISEGTLQLGFQSGRIPGLKDAVFSTNVEREMIKVSEKPEEIVFMWRSSDGIIVEKTFRFSPETYLIDMRVNIKNASIQPFKDSLFLSLVSPPPTDTSAYGFEGPSAFIDNKLEQIKIKKIEDKSIYTGKVGWIALEDRYFMTSIIPQNSGESGMHLFLNPDSVLKNQYMSPESSIHPGAQGVYEFKLFFGPKSMNILNGLGYDLKRAIDFGWFDFIAKPCLWFMNFIYGFIPNFGFAIIILTIVTKIVLWPLGTKSYKSMSEMKKIQPLMAEIREKHKTDKKKMNEELMGLYRVYKINPLGGCLPMIVQLPVFIALYRMLYEAIELRHAPFFWWINDLSAPDRLFRFGFDIPLMQPPYGIPVLTIIMGASMLLQQKMSPPPGDPNQAKMMMLMPIIFTFIFINFSSGLVLYWLVNNILSMAQQYYTTKKFS